MSDKVLVRKIAPNLWQWRAVDGAGQWSTENFYTGDINLLKETIDGNQVSLILPGQEIPSEKMPAEVSDRKQLLKILPFEMEEFIIDPVEDLHFTFGPIQDGAICVSYCDVELLENAIDEIETSGAEVQKVVPDYLQLPLTSNGWTILLENDVVLVRTQELLGFAVEASMAPAFLAALASEDVPSKILLFADNQEELYSLNGFLPGSLKETEGSLEIIEEEAGYWDLLAPQATLINDFRQGRLARKLPFSKWWGDFKVPVIVAGIAFVIALGSTWMGLNKVESERRAIMAQTDDIFRQVVPRGNISDPERQLKAMLGGGGGSAGSSNAVLLISGVAPVIKQADQVTIRSFRYSADNAELQMNLEAKGFATFEELRNKLGEVGLRAEIKNVNAVGDMHQAQLRVSEAG